MNIMKTELNLGDGYINMENVVLRSCASLEARTLVNQKLLKRILLKLDETETNESINEFCRNEYKKHFETVWSTYINQKNDE